MMKEIQKEKEWDKKHWFLASFKHAFNFMWYRLPFIIGNARHEVIWALQRTFRGYDNTATWDLFRYITDIAYPVLQWYRKNGHGVPTVEGFENKSFEEQTKAWNDVLDKMILSFELIKEEDNDFEIHSTEYYQDQNSKIQEGLKLFSTYFRHLWD